MGSQRRRWRCKEGAAVDPLAPFAGKIALERHEEFPLCPACDVPLTRLCWHKIRGGPPMLPYVVVLSCGGCRTMLDVVASSPRHAVGAVG